MVFRKKQVFQAKRQVQRQRGVLIEERRLRWLQPLDRVPIPPNLGLHERIQKNRDIFPQRPMRTPQPFPDVAVDVY